MLKHIHQVLPNFSQRDAVGTDTLLIRNYLRELGFDSEIFYEETGSGDPQFSKPLRELHPYYNRLDTAIIFHFSIGSAFPGVFVNLQNRKIVRYHNITPPEFFCASGEGHIRNVCALGRQQIPMLATFADFVMADSDYNLQEFRAYASIDGLVVPIFRDYDQLLNISSSPKLQQCIRESGKKILLFIGRICPNKAQHDLMKILALYKAVYPEELALVLVGGFFSSEFKKEIESYASYLNLRSGSNFESIADLDVVIPGSIPDEDIVTLYREASLFCSMSDHEGFGVPLVEAMNFHLPVIAHRAAAVPETVGIDECLVDKDSILDTLVRLRAMVFDDRLRRSAINQGKVRAEELSLQRAKETLRRSFCLMGIQ